jgi:crotonobetainyl-CoA:carnitine CoA-transferase CaiB-like acyl-CoA transferase
MGTSFPTVVPYEVLPARDRGVAIAVGSERLWSIFCGLLGRPELEADERFATNAARCVHRGELLPLLRAIFISEDAAVWIRKLSEAGIPCSLVRDFGEVAADPQVAVRQMFPSVHHPAAGTHRVTGTPVKLASTPGRATTAAPGLGEHTAQALAQLLELDSGEIQRLCDMSIIHDAPRA